MNVMAKNQTCFCCAVGTAVGIEGIPWLGEYWGYTVTGWVLRVYCVWVGIEGTLWLWVLRVDCDQVGIEWLGGRVDCDQVGIEWLGGRVLRVYCDWMSIEGILWLVGYLRYTVTGWVFRVYCECDWVGIQWLGGRVLRVYCKWMSIEGILWVWLGGY